MNFLFKGKEKELSELGTAGIKKGVGLRFKHNNEIYEITGNISEVIDQGGIEVSFDAENVKAKEPVSFTINQLNDITMKDKKKWRCGSTSNEKTLEYNQETLVTAINSFINKSDEGNSFNVGEKQIKVTPSSILNTLKKSTTLGKVIGEEGSYVFQPLKKIGSIQTTLGQIVCDGIVENFPGKWSPEDETKCQNDGYYDCNHAVETNKLDEEDAYLKGRLSEGRESQGRESEDKYSRFSVSKDAPPTRHSHLKRFSRFNGGKTTCSKNTTKKYKTRKSPPYPANSCKNMKKKGNDGKFYVSVAKGGTYRWMPFAKKTKSKR